MANAEKALVMTVSVAVLAASASWLYVKLYLSASTDPYMVSWSESGRCYINAYVPKFSSLGVLGKTVKLFSSNSFFRVYNKDGVLLTSSEWLLWQREFAEMEGAFWVNGYAIYPSNNGYAGWLLPECN
ncbi:hypothetical protein A9179_00090 [Pseudomonas alcaligenes]|uniref:Uncharacterized protein n=1 Tax=Aquipseudomonas alcaligenes TaxID=43263 RepID=A0ABR7RVE9_AQUAC|nr:hypothetical protein [Pseudomonas alcaligenes]MBC9248662.1 hypothetical protein [Pseudomonas alcaligenes]